MKFAVEHRTQYTYEGSVHDSINEAWLCPSSNDLQICHQFELDVSPRASILKRIDFFTNQVHHFEVHEPHRELTVVARSIVETLRDGRDFDRSTPFEALQNLRRSEAFYDFLNGSERVQLPPMIVHEAGEITAGQVDVQNAAQAIMAFVHGQFRYRRGVTGVETDVRQVFQRREGVCQDFAHVMIALCRAACVPARYVSGYFYVDRAESGTSEDNTESHAWVDCWLPGIGWVGYDPTHNRRAGESYIRIAIGRDYTDVRPVAGTFRGQNQVNLQVAVRIDQIESPEMGSGHFPQGST